MARNKGVSGKTHTKQQLDDYANQHNPNNKAYKAKVTNQKQIKKQRVKNILIMLLIWIGCVLAKVRMNLIKN